MKRYKWVVNFICVALVIIGVSGCGWVSQYDKSPYNHIFREEAVHLTDDSSSPFCDFSIDYTCLEEEKDSIAMLINRTIQREWLGEDYASLVPEEAVDSFKNVYIRDYRNEIGQLYLVDRSRVNSEDEIPNWYNQTYSLVTFVEEGYGGVINASANYYVDMGGAHPNQWSRWMNFDFETGKLLTKEEVFLSSAKVDIETLLLDKLLLLQKENYPEETFNTLEDLQEKGFLQLTNMFIPDNFLLSKKGVHFLFNRYDIAPYAAGEIVIEIPYEEIGAYLKQ
ncbi:MAG: DUF3298 domain-containing protein [Bacteroides sp.]|nr:DUF3298 domain-containing protein [Bacteroides sp.]